jgi:hypothetical protein
MPREAREVLAASPSRRMTRSGAAGALGTVVAGPTDWVRLGAVAAVGPTRNLAVAVGAATLLDERAVEAVEASSLPRAAVRAGLGGGGGGGGGGDAAASDCDGTNGSMVIGRRSSGVVTAGSAD